MGKPEIRMKLYPQSIDEIITSSMNDMKVQAEKKEITLIKDSPSELMVMEIRTNSQRFSSTFWTMPLNSLRLEVRSLLKPVMTMRKCICYILL